jgi:hypothetical protein
MTETSARPSAGTLEQRLTNLEGELRKANERVRALSEWQRKSARGRILTTLGVTLLLLVFAWVVPTPAAPTTFTVPFTVTSASTNARIVVSEHASGLGMSFYNSGGGLVLSLGVDDQGSAIVKSRTPDGQTTATLGLNGQGEPGVTLEEGGKKVAELGPGTSSNAMGLRFWNNNKEIIGLGNKGGNGFFVLADKESVARVEAGTETNGDGAVKVFGPTGKCGVALAGISCMIVAR